jgi:hypothetical protein
MAKSSPPSNIGKSNVMIDNVDGPRAMMALRYLTGMPTFLGKAGVDFEFLNTTTGLPNSTFPTVAMQAHLARGVRNGWPQYLGPFFSGSSSPAAQALGQQIFFFPLVPRHNHLEHAAPPWRWWQGTPAKGSAQGAGGLQITWGTAIDNNTITYGSQGVDVFGLFYLLPDGVFPTPQTMRIVTNQISGKTFVTESGAKRLVTLMPALSSAGAMTDLTGAYSQIAARVRGTDILRFVLNDEFDMWNMRVEDPRFGFMRSDASLTSNTNAARFTRGHVPIIMHDGSIETSPSDTGSGVEIEIVSSTLTTHDWIDAGIIPHTKDSREAAKVWSPLRDSKSARVKTRPPMPYPDNAQHDAAASVMPVVNTAVAQSPGPGQNAPSGTRNEKKG